MKKIYTADRETGTFIEECKSIEEARELIAQYEEQDKINDVYTEDFYSIVDEDHESIRYELSANIHLDEKHFATLDEAKESAQKEREYYLEHTDKRDIEDNRKNYECIYILEIGSDDVIDRYDLY